MHSAPGAEYKRLAEAEARLKHWKRWGPYLAERSWGTVREDYSPYGAVWDYFTHDHARSRVYRWTEDGILGICDNHQYLCFAFAFWNGKDPILKERLFGLSGNEGNHGEDVKEVYYYLDATPTNSYLGAYINIPKRRSLTTNWFRRTGGEGGTILSMSCQIRMFFMNTGISTFSWNMQSTMSTISSFESRLSIEGLTRPIS
jgi:hypothetical protein